MSINISSSCNCFYTIQKYTGGKIPVGDVSASVIEEANNTILRYEQSMHRHMFHQAFNIADKYVRALSKFWAKQSKAYNAEDHPHEFSQFLVDSFHMLRVATVLLHPIAPQGTEKILSQFNLDERFWNWEYIFETIYFFMDDPHTHQPKELSPRTDFFRALHFNFSLPN